MATTKADSQGCDSLCCEGSFSIGDEDPLAPIIAGQSILRLTCVSYLLAETLGCMSRGIGECYSYGEMGHRAVACPRRSHGQQQSCQ